SSFPQTSAVGSAGVPAIGSGLGGTFGRSAGSGGYGGFGGYGGLGGYGGFYGLGGYGGYGSCGYGGWSRGHRSGLPMMSQPFAGCLLLTLYRLQVDGDILWPGSDLLPPPSSLEPPINSGLHHSFHVCVFLHPSNVPRFH
ncbi:hypothetical protein CIB84_014505, partial [Bambusicola thoracicus]